MLKVSLPGSTLVDYRLPSLTPAEAEFIGDVERRIEATMYDVDRVVPVFWDTETTGLQGIEWWDDAKAPRIVQLGALTDSKHGSFQFKRNINPYPKAMNPDAAKTTGLSTQQVWGSAICPQVCSPASVAAACLHARTIESRMHVL